MMKEMEELESSGQSRRRKCVLSDNLLVMNFIPSFRLNIFVIFGLEWHLNYRSNASESTKPKKLDLSKQNFLERAKQEEAEKIAEERRRRNEEDRKLREK